MTNTQRGCTGMIAGEYGGKSVIYHWGISADFRSSCATASEVTSYRLRFFGKLNQTAKSVLEA